MIKRLSLSTNEHLETRLTFPSNPVISSSSGSSTLFKRDAFIITRSALSFFPATSSHRGDSSIKLGENTHRNYNI
ncbi:hypothetical protein E2C01_088202 [Portunus trituberculatus]|uniref:Uncharacterized protein n=1 Tax=Portunus trituberculatus TaxID=210409 RepID=A0A5B7JER7_PORTR|nr:hypothetical protein [Portunus trituberculatus]